MSTITATTPFPIVRATVPLAAPIPWTSGASPLTVQSPDGRKLQTQCEVVRRDAHDNAAVVEVIALDPTPRAGAYIALHEPQTDRSPKIVGWARDLLGTAPRFSFGDGVEVQTKWEQGYYRNGDVCQTRRFAGPHITGWLTVFAGLNSAELEFKLHDGDPGSPHFFFRELALLGGHAYANVMPEPLATATKLIGPRADGKLHCVPQMRQRHFRMVLGAALPDTLAHHAARGGRTISDAWTKVRAWGPTEQRLPNMPAANITNANNWIAAETARRRDAMLTGAAIDMGLAMQLGRVGIGYTTGSKYGGVTGGGGRELYDQLGVWTAITRNTLGIEACMIEAAAVAWRQPVIVAPTGRVVDSTEYAGWLVSAADSEFESQSGQQNYHDGEFGFRAARSVMPPAGTYDAAELAELMSIAPVDFQHYVRALSAAQSLVYLTNDPMAKHDIMAMAEWHRMSMATSNRLSGEAARVAANPGKLTYWGRGQGHGFDAQAAALGVAPIKWRNERRDALAAFARAVVAAQAPNGCLQGTVGHKVQKEAPFTIKDPVTNVVLSSDATSKATETTILAHAAVGCALATDAVNTDSMVLRLGVDGIAGFHGAATMTAAWDWTAVRPAHPQAAPYATPPSTANHDQTEYAIVLGLALDVCNRRGTQPDPQLIAAICKRCGNVSNINQALGWFYSQTTVNKSMIDDTLPLIAALEAQP